MASLSSTTSSGLLTPPHSIHGDGFCPYPLGKSFIIKHHTPPAPTGRSYGRSPTSEPVGPGEITQLQWYLDHSPNPGTIDNNNNTREIIFVDTIRAGCKCGAQIMLTEDGLVAKIYDPLEYSFEDRGFTRDDNAEVPWVLDD
ncbi:hypothetical protein E8E12_008356 [Didymella heteroderae]|uniref:Uncharacterized protein n=1 Tax=Didymella heteroderae TaxID=1769908 RepID=A0A9P4WU20_9PLEO|nr:hypothetical protein E8E12_008356 [Didymella heteroderae]